MPITSAHSFTVHTRSRKQQEPGPVRAPISVRLCTCKTLAVTMAALAATSCATAATCFVQKPLGSTSQRAIVRPVVGLPVLQRARIVCSAERKEEKLEGFSKIAAAASSAAYLAAAHPAVALVDERLSGEGTGLSLGISNSKLAWILVGVTTLVWSLYFVYSSNLPEGDDDSGLSL